jgi:hypothetical protein
MAKSPGGFKPGFSMGGMPKPTNPKTTNPFTDGFNPQPTKPAAPLSKDLRVAPIATGPRSK